MIEDNPICSLLCTVIIVVFSLYFTNVIKGYSCNKDIVSTFCSNFVHIDRIHLFSNVLTLYSMSEIEKKMGSYNFLKLVVLCLTINTILETTLHKINKELKCSIGISGLLISIIVYDTFVYHEINTNLLLSLFVLIFFTPIKHECISIYGHLIGFISGIILVLFLKFPLNNISSM